MKVEDKWIIEALSALKEAHIVNNSGIYKSEYKGYISSFGAAIVQCGLLPVALAFSKDNKDNKDKVCEAVVRLLETCGQQRNIGNDFIGYLCLNSSQIPALTREVAQAITALKLALRFYQSDNSDNNGTTAE